MTYRQITFEERYSLGLLRQGGLAPAAIARVLGRHRSTVTWEVQRNRATSDGTYRPPLADWYARGRRSRSRRNRQFSGADLQRIRVLLAGRWSPEQVAGRLRLEGRLQISHETIYRYIWADKAAGGTLYTHLCAVPGNSDANATAATTAEAAWPGSGRSAPARPWSRRVRSSGTGRPTPWWAPAARASSAWSSGRRGTW